MNETAPNVQLVISAPYGSNSTRAANEGAYVSKATTDELIKSYIVAVTPQGSNQIVAFAYKGGLGGVESAPVDLQLRAGNYTVYGFANIPATDLAALGIKKDGTIPTDLGTLRTLVPGTTLFKNAIAPDEPLLVHSSQLGTAAFPAIPMSSVAGQNVTVTERVNQTFGIEVRRMLAKLQFDFRNPTPSDVYIHGIKVGDMTLNEMSTDVTPLAPLRLMNYEEARNTIELPAKVQTATAVHDFGSAPLKLDKNYVVHKLVDGTFDPAYAPSASATFYVLESAAHTTGSNPNTFQLDFNVTNTSDGSSLLGDNMRYAITNPDNLTLIHRNDWIVIPITIGEWVMDLTALSFPPIGGYPDAKVTSDKEDVFSVTFSAPGDIAFYPVIHKYYDSSKFFYLNDPDWIKPGSTSITVDDPSGIFPIEFRTGPTIGSAGEIPASLSGTPGKAKITIKTTFYPNYPNVAIEKEFTGVIEIEKV